MKIRLNTQLKALNKVFLKNNTSLYIVGGFVRDCLLKQKPTDIDLASKLTNDELQTLLQNTPFTMKLASKKLGTSIIKLGTSSFEHTTFRKEQYPMGGVHTPSEVSFVTDLKTDAMRRDFTINSMYYDIQQNKIVDFFYGQADLKQKKVRAIISPEFVFENDGLRILRMIRIAAELNFLIEEKTYETAKQMIHQLNDISKDRKYKEFTLILTASKKYGNTNKKILSQFFKLGAMPFIFKNLNEFTKKESLQNLSEHLFYFYVKNNAYLLDTFYLDLALFLAKQNNTSPSNVLKKLLTLDCGISKNELTKTVARIQAYEALKQCTTHLQIKKFLQQHHTQLAFLKVVLNNKKDASVLKQLKQTVAFMKKQKLPFTIQQLSITGKQLEQALNIKDKKQIGVLLNKALHYCLINKNNNTKENLMLYLKNEHTKGEK
jgi:tRNA nucleotidyltransferase/poly(A) polymerase